MPGTANSRGCRLGGHGWLSSVHINRHTLELLRRPAVMPSLPSVLPLGRRVAAAAGRPKADAPISRDTQSFGAAQFCLSGGRGPSRSAHAAQTSGGVR